jgi:hypothetical protein
VLPYREKLKSLGVLSNCINHLLKGCRKISRRIEEIAGLQKKLVDVIKVSNEKRKSAAARANRYKAKYENLLDDILPEWEN